MKDEQRAQFILHLRSIHFSMVVVCAITIVSISSINPTTLERAYDEARMLQSLVDELDANHKGSTLDHRTRLSWLSAFLPADEIDSNVDRRLRDLRRIPMALDSDARTAVCDLVITFNAAFYIDESGRAVQARYDPEDRAIERMDFVDPRSTHRPRTSIGFDDARQTSTVISLWNVLSSGDYAFINGAEFENTMLFAVVNSRRTPRPIPAQQQAGTPFGGFTASDFDERNLTISELFRLIDLPLTISSRPASHRLNFNDGRTPYEFAEDRDNALRLMQLLYGDTNGIPRDARNFFRTYWATLWEYYIDTKDSLSVPARFLNKAWIIAPCFPRDPDNNLDQDLRTPLFVALMPVRLGRGNHPFLATPAIDLEDGLSDKMFERLRQPSGEAFTNLLQLEEGLAHSPHSIRATSATLGSTLRFLNASGSTADSAEFFGVVIPGEFLRVGGALSVLGLQFYFLLHYRNLFNRILAGQVGRAYEIAPWIGLFPGWAAQLATYATGVVMPSLTIWFTKHPDEPLSNLFNSGLPMLALVASLSISAVITLMFLDTQTSERTTSSTS